jgi:EAL domain-containing protein (putative c-di-GMP-specific phosphodiesterase class I)
MSPSRRVSTIALHVMVLALAPTVHSVVMGARWYHHLRWHHPDRGLLYPDQFLPVA